MGEELGLFYHFFAQKSTDLLEMAEGRKTVYLLAITNYLFLLLKILVIFYLDREEMA